MKTNELKSARVKMSYTQCSIAKALGMRRDRYNRKENGNVPFTNDEIMKIKKVLNLDPKQIDEIFFTEECSLNEQS